MVTATWKVNTDVLKGIEDGVRKVQSRVTQLAHDSIVFGDPDLGTQGQPEDLREGQWKISEAANESLIYTDDPSARSVEDGISHLHGGPITLNSPIGGFDSVKKTVQQGERLIEKAVREVKR